MDFLETLFNPLQCLTHYHAPNRMSDIWTEPAFCINFYPSSISVSSESYLGPTFLNSLFVSVFIHSLGSRYALCYLYPRWCTLGCVCKCPQLPHHHDLALPSVPGWGNRASGSLIPHLRLAALKNRIVWFDWSIYWVFIHLSIFLFRARPSGGCENKLHSFLKPPAIVSLKEDAVGQILK